MTMRKIWITLMAILLLCLSLCSCTYEGLIESEDVQLSDTVPLVINEDEYIVYGNVYQQHSGYMYEGQRQTKTGILCTVYDHHADKARYFVWGYCDDKLNRDWQWELKVKDPQQLPPDGSLIEVTGTFQKSTKAFSEYWLTQTSWTVKMQYTGEQYDLNMACMNTTLAATQMEQLHHEPSYFEGKTLSLIGKVDSADTIRHPHSEEMWHQTVQTTTELSPVGAGVLVTGVWRNGVVTEAVVTPSWLYS